MKVLFCREFYADGDPNRGPSDGNFLMPTLRASGMGEHEVFWWDRIVDEDRDAALLDMVKKCSPDVVACSFLLSWGERNIKPETLNRIRADGIKVVGLWHEGVAPDVVRVADLFAPHVDLNVFLDTERQFLKYTRWPGKCLGLLDPRDPTAFRPTGVARDIPASFVGTVVGRPLRCQGLFTLLANRVPVRIFERHCWLTGRDYASLLSRSLIGINFPDAAQFRHYKGRVAEILLCGALLFEMPHEDVAFLEPYRHYVPFEVERPKEFVEKVLHYLSARDERERIAVAGCLRATEMLTGKMFWGKLFERLGLTAQLGL